MIDCSQIFDKIPEYNHNQPDYFDYYNKFIIVISLFLIIPSAYYLYIKRKNAASLLNTSPKETIISVNKQFSLNKDDIFSEISSCGGFIPYLRKLHADQG